MPVVASEPMKIPATVLLVGKLALLSGATIAGSGCLGPRGKLQVDTPALPYQKPDISEITGIDEDQDSDSDAGSAAASGSGSAQPGK